MTCTNNCVGFVCTNTSEGASKVYTDDNTSFSVMHDKGNKELSLKTLDTTGICQRPVFSLAVSQHA